MPQRYISNKNETVRMFESDFMEFFSHVHPVTPLVIYLPVIGYMLYVAIAQRALPIVAVAGLFAPRYPHLDSGRVHDAPICFPLPTEERLGKTASLSGARRAPRLSARTPAGWLCRRVVSVPLACFSTDFSLSSLGTWRRPPFAGLLFGYLCYDMIHYATHHFSMKRGVWLWLKQYHMRHHYKDDHIGYGVSSPLWDYVLDANKRTTGRISRRKR